MATPSPKATPKRKRDGETPLSPIKFSFDLSKTESAEDGSSSPRSRVAHRFRGLALGSGGGVVNDDAEDGDSPDSARKRQRSDEVMADAAEVDLQQQRASPTPLSKKVSSQGAATSTGDLSARLRSSVDDIPEPDTNSPRRRRAGTPPLKLKKSPKKPKKNVVEETEPIVPGEYDEDDDDVVVDPVRAALTWHEDEITIYDPNDEDDDGTGINGVGFRPTPAIAHARAMRRRHQMAEYRKREESEARAKRSQRRRGEEGLSVRPKKRSPSRRVRFVDSERQNVAVITQ
ncbi:hypothetical protein VFPPC_14333 [Pochonia chlamydosporia 170]|uniref:Uncharacterized protein n=1 Tax=Pochonia chlamydosporia 170 TaxID=1380566 RepID=A0A179FMN0_METCM|nr:hypothetical protein VFPPC_14333 [Pochonia chlamydosporia 170]OAQ66421.1 hypothetical protein VFPPC_14333 [Pochonia chlamydosporia 170]